MEAVFASFLLMTSILISVYVFDSSLQAEANNEQRITAAMVAESALEEMRAYANTSFQDLKTAYNGREWTLPSYRDFEIQALVEAQELPIPCTELESPYPEAPEFPIPERRVLGNSVWKCEVAVSWSRSPNERLRMVRYMADFTPVEDFVVQISPAGGNTIDGLTTGTFSVDSKGELDFTARATAGGRPVRDVQFTWFVEPLDGFGSIYRVSRDGTQCLYKNQYRNYDGKIKVGPGQCNVVVSATYQGVEAKRKVRVNNAP